MKTYRALFFILPLCALFGCKQYYLSVCQEWVDVNYLASTAISTPDPRQENPPVGQMLILDWRVPKEIFDQNPVVILDLILWDYTTREIRIPIRHRMDFAAYRLLNEEYHKSEGILTYKARIETQDGTIFKEWRHQLWVNLIKISDAQVMETGNNAT